MKLWKKRGGNLIIFLLLSVLLFPSRALAEENRAPSAPVKLTEEEKAYIAEKKEVVIGCQTDICPLIFQDKKTGEFQGITIDILELISESVGLPFRYEEFAPGSVTYQDLQEMKVDLVASVEYNEINKHALGIVMTDPYLQTEKIFVCKKGVVFEADKEMVIAAASGSQTLSKVIRDIYPGFRVDYYRTMEDALAALLDGKADAVLQNQYSLQRIIAKPVYEDLRVIDAAKIGDAHCLGAMVPIGDDKQNIVDKDTELLLSILNKGIRALDPNEVSFIIIKETSENVYQFTFEDFIYRYRYALAFVAVGIVFICFLLWKIHTLQKKRAEQIVLERKNKELSAVNEQMKEQQMLLEDALLRAEAGSEAKSCFLFNMSHDIRTPMNAILGLADIALKHTDDPKKVSDSLKKISSSGKQMMQLLNDVLDMSRIEQGEETLTETACDLPDEILKVQDIFQAEIEKKDLRICSEVAEVANRGVHCDVLRMRQILFHLMSNAVKFSKEGGMIWISLSQSEAEVQGFASYELRVKDQGIGMAKEFQKHIFEPFERERTSTMSGVQGPGLGMSITKSLVDLMGGIIEVESEPGQGTEFTLRLILKVQEEEIPPEQEEETAAKVDFTGRRLLLVEDNEINMEIAREILECEGFEIETAENGQIAVEMMQASEPGHYDLVLMDIQMPVMDGYQATKEIRSLEREEHAKIPIVAMTANTFEEDKKRALASGMNAHVAKPIDQQVLFDTLRTFL